MSLCRSNQQPPGIYCISNTIHSSRESNPLPDMGIYRDNLSAIGIGDNFLPIIVMDQNGLDLSITDIAFVIYFVIADKLSR